MAEEIKERLDTVLGDYSLSFKTVHTWVAEFKRGRTSCEDSPSTGRPNEVTIPEMVEKIHKLVLEDCRFKVRQIAEIMDISTERVHYILQQQLQIARLLTVDQKQRRKDVLIECLDRSQRDKMEFHRSFTTVDETWIHHYIPESKQQSKQSVKKGQPASKKAKIVNRLAK